MPSPRALQGGGPEVEDLRRRLREAESAAAACAHVARVAEGARLEADGALTKARCVNMVQQRVYGPA